MTEESIFIEALEKEDDAERAAFLDQACAGDEALRRRIERLLRRHEQPDSLLDAPAAEAGVTVDQPAADRPGAVMGPYKLLQPIGEGGMGTVYMAEQTRPVKRLVALKLIKAGMDSRQVLARFEAERQALALMDHPNIAKVLDAGSTEQGRPYFVMELVKGVPITKFCDERRLTPRERLELAIPVCQAVQHAHQKGIIHRDLKPSNVLIALYDGKPVPKVIDFGVAKATGQRLTDQTLYTEFGAVVGTLEYMSPEQAELNQIDIDTRSDIYSLGVLLYELLTGTTPLERKRLKEAAFLEVLRVIREEESQRPSMRLSTTDELPSIAACRNIEPRKLSGLVRGELDWIVMKALEKDRSRRYEAASGLAADLRRYLDDEPVQAGPPSAAYRFRKFARRNKVALLTAAIVTLALLAGTAISIHFSIQAYHRAREAEQARQRARSALDNMSSHLIDDWLARQEKLTDEQKKFLEGALASYEEFTRESGDTPELRMALARAHIRVGNIRLRLGLRPEADAAYRQAVGILEKLTADFPNVPGYQQDLAYSHNNRGLVLADLGKKAEAGAEYRLALTIQEKLAAHFPSAPAYRQELARRHGNLGTIVDDLGKRGEAEVEFRAALTIQEGLAADFPAVPAYQQDLAKSRNNLGNLLAGLGKRGEAEAEVRSALKIQGTLAADFPTVPEYRMDLAKHHNSLAALLDRLGKRGEAVAEVRSALRIQGTLATDFPSVPAYRVGLANSHQNLGVLLNRLGNRGEAEAEYRAALTVQEKLAGDFPTVAEYRHDLAQSHSGLGDLLDRLGKPGEAEAEYRAALTVQENLAADFPTVREYLHELGRSHFGLGVLLAALDKRAAAEAEYRAALTILEKLAAHFPDVPVYAVEVGGSLCNIGELERANGRPQQALEWYAKAVHVLERLLATDSRDARQFLRNAHARRAQVLDQLNRFADATKEWDRAIELDEGPQRSQIRRLRALSLARAGDHAKAVAEANALVAEKGITGAALYDLACVVSLASAAVKDDAKLREQYAARAVELLRKAESARFFKSQKEIERMKKDTDLDSIRGRQDYKKLLDSLTPMSGR